MINHNLLISIIKIIQFIHPYNIPPLDKGKNDLSIIHCSTIELIHLLSEVYGYCVLNHVKKIQEWRFHGAKRSVQNALNKLSNLGLYKDIGYAPGSRQLKIIALTDEGEKIKDLIVENRESFVEELISLLKKGGNDLDKPLLDNFKSKKSSNESVNSNQNLSIEFELDKDGLEKFLLKLEKFADKAWEKIEKKQLKLKDKKQKRVKEDNPIG